MSTLRRASAVALSTVCLATFATLSLGSCEDPLPPYEEPAGWADDLALQRPIDLDPDPHVLEIDLVASEVDLEIVKGKTTRVYAFNGSVPGPLLELTAGDRLIVHFENQLPEETTIHWHGIRLPNAMDGAPHHSQEPVKPGGKFDYDFIVPDAGFFWYHPHVSSSKQVGFGLYGPLLVRPADDSEANLPKDELVLVLSDMGIADDGKLVDPMSGGEVGSALGREGNVILANGKRLPSIRMRSGVTQRWRIVNAARSRYFKLEMETARFYRIGGDGGLLEHPVQGEDLVLAPGQRADVLLTPVDSGEGLDFLFWLPFDRGFGSADLRYPEEIMSMDFLDAPEPKLVPMRFPDVQRDVVPIDTTSATPVVMRLTQTKDAEGHLEMGINDVPFDEAVPFPAKIGETQVWDIQNTMPWAHPFHLHGYFFQALDASGAPEDPLEWRDTLSIPVDGRRMIAVRFDDRPGHWMFHCHILDHADEGMMGMVHVQP